MRPYLFNTDTSASHSTTYVRPQKQRLYVLRVVRLEVYMVRVTVISEVY